jgi:hypothetical protein
LIINDNYHGYIYCIIFWNLNLQTLYLITNVLLRGMIMRTRKKLMFTISFFILLMIIAGCGTENSGGSSSADNNTGTVTLSWKAPKTNTDGTPLNDLGGYNVYYGPSSGNYTYSVDVGITSGTVISGLGPGTWCFALTAYNHSGFESDYSAELCKTV